MSPHQPDERGAESPAMYRWQGGIDARLEEHSRRLDAINGDAKAARETAEQIVVQLAVLRTKVAVWASLGGLVGAGVVSGLVALLTKLGTGG